MDYERERRRRKRYREAMRNRVIAAVLLAAVITGAVFLIRGCKKSDAADKDVRFRLPVVAGQTDARRHGDGASVLCRHRSSPHRDSDPFERPQRVVARRSGQDEEKLLAPIPSGDVVVPEGRTDAARRLLKHFIPDQVSERVVHVLEEVQVEKSDAKPLPLPT